MTARAAPAAATECRLPLVDERLVAWLWSRQLLAPERVQTADGQRLSVLYAGRPWGEPGPDFQGALLLWADGRRQLGDVEVHVRASDWRAHGHHRNPAYNRTALHVVYWRDSAEPTRRADGVAVPVLELAPALARPLDELVAAHQAEAACTRAPLGCQPDPAIAGPLLDRAGLERFAGKAAAFAADLAGGVPARPNGRSGCPAGSPAQAFYRGLLGALGYTPNAEPMRRLAELVPAEAVAWVARELGPLGLEALLLGAAGLLPSQRPQPPLLPGPPDERVARLEALWRDLRTTLGGRPLGRRDWRLQRVRPENLPARRLAGAAALLAAAPPARLLDDALAAVHAIGTPQPDSGRAAELVARFRVRAPDPYWAHRYDFDLPTAGPRPWLVGRARALEIVVNVLLPLAHALGRATGDDRLAAAALLIYRALPAGPGNRVVAEMALQLCGPRARQVVRTACRQQGLIHLFRQACAARSCATCPAFGGTAAAAE